MPKRSHKDTSVSLYPLTFEEAIWELAHAPKREDSQAAGSGNYGSAHTPA